MSSTTSSTISSTQSSSKTTTATAVSYPALTTVFTPPASCATEWVGFTRGPPEGPKYTYIQRIVEDSWINFNDCYPPSTSAARLKEAWGDWVPRFHSPGICPSGYTTEHSSYKTFSSDRQAMVATCCPSGYSYFTSATGQRYSVYSKSHYCTAVFRTSITALDASEGFNPTLRASTSRVYTDGMKAMNAITVQWERSDLTLFPTDARPEVGTRHLEKMGEDRSLVFTPGQSRPTGLTSTGRASEMASETTSRSGGVSLRCWRVKDIMSLGVVAVIFSVTCGMV